MNNMFNFKPIMPSMLFTPSFPLIQPIAQQHYGMGHHNPLIGEMTSYVNPMTPSIPMMQPKPRQLNQRFNNYNTTSYSFTQQLNPDGSRTVHEQNKINNNGNIDSQVNNYKIDANGNKFCLR